MFLWRNKKQYYVDNSSYLELCGGIRKIFVLMPLLSGAMFLSCSNPFMPSGHLPQLFGQVHFQKKRCLIRFYYNHIEIPVFNANSVDPDQTPHSALSTNVPFMGCQA